MPAIATIATAIAAAVLGLLVTTPQGRRQVATMAAVVAGWMLNTIFLIAPTVAVVFADGLVTAFEKNKLLWAQVVSIFVRELTGTTVSTADFQSLSEGGGLGRSAPQIFAPLVSAVTDIIAPTGTLTPESGLTGLNRVFGTTMALGLQGWWIEAVGDIVSLGKFGSAADLPHAIESGLGLNRLGRLVWRSAVKKAIGEPLDELYNRRYHFAKLSIGEARSLWHRGALTDEDFLDVAAAHGYDHTKAAQLLELGKQTYSTAQIEEMSRFMDMPRGLLIQFLREQGWDSGRAHTLLNLGEARETQKHLDALAAQARKLYGIGRISQAQLEAILNEARVSRHDIGIIMATEDLIRAESKVLTVAEIHNAYAHGIIESADARRRLRLQGYRDEDIDILLATVRRQLSVGQIIELVTRQTITREEAVRRLEVEGYSRTDADLLVSLKGRRLSEGQILDALRNRLINAQQARTDLQQLGFPVDQVDILLSFLRRELSPAEVQTALLRGILTETEAMDRLLRAGYTPADARVIIELRFRLMRIGDILTAFEDGFITRTETLSDLQARGFSADSALNIVRSFELDLFEKLHRAPPARPPHQPGPVRQPPPSRGRRGTGGSPPAAPAP